MTPIENGRPRSWIDQFLTPGMDLSTAESWFDLQARYNNALRKGSFDELMIVDPDHGYTFDVEFLMNFFEPSRPVGNRVTQRVTGSGLLAYTEYMRRGFPERDIGNEDPVELSKLAEPLYDPELPNQALNTYLSRFGLMSTIDVKHDGRVALTYLTHTDKITRDRTNIGIMTDLRMVSPRSAPETILGALMVLPVGLLKKAKEHGVLVYSASGEFLPYMGVPERIVRKIGGDVAKTFSNLGSDGKSLLYPIALEYETMHRDLLTTTAMTDLFTRKWNPVLVGSYYPNDRRNTI